MTNTNSKTKKRVFISVFLSFFVMGFVDIVGIATNYVKKDFMLSDSLANLIPMMVFLWFAIFSLPTSMLMGKVGRKKTVLLSLAITSLTMLIPLFFYNYFSVLVAFALLGIGNTILQVSLNPLAAAIVNKEKLTSTLTLGQFIKAVSSFLGPILVGFAASTLGNWRLTFLAYSVMSVLSVLLLYYTPINEVEEDETPSSSFKDLLRLLKDSYLLYGIIGILLIVGIDVALNTSIPKLLMDRTNMELSQAGLGTSLYFAARTIGTLLGAFLLMKLSSVKFLKYSILVAIAAFLMLINVSELWLILPLIVVIGLACSNVFSIIFSLALQHDMKHANEISALMIMGVSGGALLPPLQGVFSDLFGFTIGMYLILVCLIGIGAIAFKLKS